MPMDKLMKKGKSRKEAMAIMMAEKRKGSKKSAPKKSRGFATL